MEKKVIKKIDLAATFETLDYGDFVVFPTTEVTETAVRTAAYRWNQAFPQLPLVTSVEPGKIKVTVE